MDAHTSRFAAAFQPLPLVAMLTLLLVATLAVASAGGLFDGKPAVVPPVTTPSASPSAVPSATPTVPPSAPASPA